MFHFNWLQHLASDTPMKSQNKMLLIEYVGHIGLISLTDGHLGRHLKYFRTLNDARVASVGFIKNNASTTRISKEKNFKIKFQVILVFYRTMMLKMDFRIRNFISKSEVFANFQHYCPSLKEQLQRSNKLQYLARSFMQSFSILLIMRGSALNKRPFVSFLLYYIGPILVI